MDERDIIAEFVDVHRHYKMGENVVRALNGVQVIRASTQARNFSTGGDHRPQTLALVRQASRYSSDKNFMSARMLEIRFGIGGARRRAQT